MSKVEVKKGDEFFAYDGDLLKRRGNVYAAIVVTGKFVTECWETYEGALDGESVIPHVAARAWIESLGGTVVEEREEEDDNKGYRTVFVYKNTSGYLYFHEKKMPGDGIELIGTTTIHIAGVTA